MLHKRVQRYVHSALFSTCSVIGCVVFLEILFLIYVVPSMPSTRTWSWLSSYDSQTPQCNIPQCTTQNRKVHISVLNSAWWDMGQKHCEIYEIGLLHYGDVIMGAIASQITSLTIVYSTVYSDADKRKHQSSVSLAFVRGIHRGPVNSPHKWQVTRKMQPLDDVIMVNMLVHDFIFFLSPPAGSVFRLHPEYPDVYRLRSAGLCQLSWWRG